MKKRLLSAFMALALCLTLLPTVAFAEGAAGGAASRETITVEGGQPTATGAPAEGGGQLTNTGEGEQPNSETDTQTEIRCTSKPTLIQRSYDGTTDGSTIPINLTFTDDGTNEIKLKEGTGFTAKKTFDSADAGRRTVTVEIKLIGDAAAKYKLKAGEETFTIGGYIDKAYPDLNVSLSKTACTVGEKLLPLLSLSGVKEDAAVTYYYTQHKTIAGDSECEGSEAMPEIDENTAISSLDEEGNNTYYVYAKTGETKNYEEERSTPAELTVNEAVVEAASVTKADGTVSGTYKTLPAALNAAQDGDTVKLLANHTTNWSDVEAGEEQMAVVKTRITLDLNGHTVDYLVVGEVVPDEEGGILETFYGNLTVVDNIQGGSHGKIKDLEFVKGSLAIQGGQIGDSDGDLTCNVNSGNATISGGTVLGLEVSEGATVTVNGGTVLGLKVSEGAAVTVNDGSAHAGAWLNDGTLTITGGTFDSVWFRNNGGTIAIRGGTFGEITNENASGKIPVMSLLADGYAFYGKDADEKYTVLQNSSKTTLENVKVLEHTEHSFLNGACIACGALTCDKSNNGEEGGCIAHVTILHYTWHIKTLDQIAYHLSAVGQWSSNYPTVTVEFLSDVTTDTSFRIEQCLTYATLDLDGHTISGELSGSPVAEVNYLYGVHCVIIQNGTIENTAENGTALQLSSGATTLENVDVKGDLALTYTFASSANYTPTFLGGGSFTRIHPVANDVNGKWSKKLSEMLGEGCWFLDSAGDRINANKWLGSTDNSNINELVNVRVKACDHKDADGKYTLFEDAEMRYGSLAKRCTVCGNLCPHDEITEGQNPTCVACGLPIVIKTTNLLNGKAIGPWYYTGLNDAMYEILHVNKGRRPTLELLADTESDSSYEWMTNDYDGIFIDLAGHTLKLTGDQNKASYWVTIQNTSDTHAEVRGTVNVYHKDSRSKLVILDTDNNLTIETVKFVDDGTAELAGGSFGKITVPTGKPLASLLVSGYYFADSNSTTGAPAALYDADGTALTELTNVTVKPCSHNEAIYVPADGGAWKCYCGQKTFVASVTKDDTTTLYTDLQEAFKAADGGTVELMANMVDVTVNTEKPFIFDLNGHSIHKLTVNSKITLKDSSEGEGKIVENLIVEAEGLTVGDLLEEGYAFRSCSDNSWYGETLKTVGNARVQQVPITSVTAANPSVTVAYGQTSGVTLTATVVPFAEGGTYTCQWYKIGGTVSPLDGATDSTYQLPVDLAAGTYTYRLTATEDGYEKSCDFTVTVTPVSIEGAAVNVQSLTYNGVAQNPTATVTLGETVLTGNKDYTVMTTAQTNVGSYTLTVTGKGNYTGKIENVNWKIEPMQLYRFCDIEPVTKVYDGTAVAPIAKSALAFHDANARGASVTLPEDAYDITNARFTMRQGDGTYVESPEAGNGKSLSFTVMLKSGNYVFKDGTADVMDCDYTTNNVDMFTIMQDTISLSGIQFTQYVFNDLAKTYTIDLPALPALESPRTYGDTQYAVDQSSVKELTQGYNAIQDVGFAVNPDNGKTQLTFHAPAVENQTEGSVGAIKITVTPTNYEPVTLIVNLQSVNKRKLGMFVSVATDPIVYGMTLGDIKLSADATVDNQVIPGTIAWEDPLTTVPAAGQATYRWTFTPDDTMHYLTASNTITFSVDKATPTGAPAYTAITAGGKTLSDAALTANASWPSGTVQWVDKDGKPLPASTQVQANTEYTWSFTPADAANYNGATGSVTLYAVSSGGGGGGGSSSTTTKTDTATNPDGSVTKTETKRDGTVIETTTGKDGSVSKTTTNPNGSSVTETKAADGSTGTVKTDKHGQTTAETTLSSKAIEDAKRNGEPVKAPVEVKATRNSDTAPTVKVELPKNSGDTKVEIPVSNVKPGTVAVLVHADGTEEIVKNSLPTEDGIQLTVNGGATVKIVDNSKGFIDTQDHWAEDAIDFVSARGLVNGMSATIYAPDASTTRAQLWTILARQNDADLTGGSIWYEKAQNWAKEKGISDGMNPNGTINRAQMVTMLWRAMGQPAAGGSASFADVPADSYYAQAVAWAIENGITAGVGGGRFDPNSTCTRAQIATFLWRAMAE